MVCPVS